MDQSVPQPLPSAAIDALHQGRQIEAIKILREAQCLGFLFDLCVQR